MRMEKTMQKLRFDAAHETKLFDVTWDQDRATRLEPVEFTKLLREQVPVLEFVQWEIKEVDLGGAETILPLNAQSTNQHFTHQAALLVLAADYTGGVALASLLTGWPVLGVHPVASRYSVSMWLLKVDIKFLRPSVADLTVTAKIDPDLHERIQKRFFEGKTVVETINIEFRNGDTPVAEATATYFARQSDKLRAEGISTERVNTLYQLKLTSSAEMIAGVRARETGKLFDDPYAYHMAGQHGVAIANRFCDRTPQLGGMVAARTRHLDDTLRNFVRAGGRQVVNVGVGWDMRAFRLDLPAGVKFYELDFPTTLEERRRRLAQQDVVDRPGITRIEAPIDLRTMSLADVLNGQIDLDQPILLAWEGMSMYFSEEEVLTILEGMRPLLRHPDSLLWLDLVDREPVETPERFPVPIQQFMRGMRVLGEPFTFGVDDAEAFLQSADLRCLEAVRSDAYLSDKDDPVYSVYQFCVASRAAEPAEELPLTFQAARFDGVETGVSVPHFALNGHVNDHANEIGAPMKNGVDSLRNLAEYPRQPR
jgi:methyltransferase (TIGR00027 family)